MVQQDLCNSHVSIASCAVERGQLILRREKGSVWARKGKAPPQAGELTGTLDLACKIEQTELFLS